MKEQTVPSMERILELQQLIADLAKIERVPILMDTGRRENDVEHSYGLAVTCWYLVPKIAPKLDMVKVFKYALAHDSVEIHSGDVFAFDADKVTQKAEQEAKSLDRLEADWPDFTEFTKAAHDYFDKADPEARFVYAIDKILPSIMTKKTGDPEFWVKHKVTREMHEAEKLNKMSISPEASVYIDLLNEWMADPDQFYKPN